MSDHADTPHRDDKSQRTQQYIRDLVAQAPPLTDRQRDQLAMLLRPARQMEKPSGDLSQSEGPSPASSPTGQ